MSCRFSAIVILRANSYAISYFFLIASGSIKIKFSFPLYYICDTIEISDSFGKMIRLLARTKGRDIVFEIIRCFERIEYQKRIVLKKMILSSPKNLAPSDKAMKATLFQIPRNSAQTFAPFALLHIFVFSAL